MPANTTKWFDEALMGVTGGTPVGYCCCGRTVYSNSEYYEDGEREGLDAKAKEHPGRFVYQDYDAISIVTLGDREFVLGCPCGELVWLERFIWSHKREIAKYIKERSRDAMAELQAATELLEEG